jgi:hypothetical protein
LRAPNFISIGEQSNRAQGDADIGEEKYARHSRRFPRIGRARQLLPALWSSERREMTEAPAG